jgi:hypothetical protein
VSRSRSCPGAFSRRSSSAGSQARGFTLRFRDEELTVGGDLAGADYVLRDARGVPLVMANPVAPLSGAMELSIADPIPWQVAVMTAVAVDQKYAIDSRVTAVAS